MMEKLIWKLIECMFFVLYKLGVLKDKVVSNGKKNNYESDCVPTPIFNEKVERHICITRKAA